MTLLQISLKIKNNAFFYQINYFIKNFPGDSEHDHISF